MNGVVADVRRQIRSHTKLLLQEKYKKYRILLSANLSAQEMYQK